MARLTLPRISLLILVTLLSINPAFSQSDLNEALLLASPGTIAANPELSAHMNTIAEAAISEHCAACHGTDLTEQTGVPNLVDFDWLWGVSGFEMTATEAVMEIMQTILYGVRDTDCPEESKRYGACPDTRFSEMPAYTSLDFSQSKINDFTEYVLFISGRDADEKAVVRAQNNWEICSECHGDDGYGYKPFGGPDLTDDIWLFGDSREQILDVIANGRTESCPAWSTRLDMVSIKALSVTIYNRSMGY